MASALGGRDAVAETTLIGGDIPGQASVQRGGIDSDPLVRVLARRAWGDRDREWFELRGVRKGEAVAFVDAPIRGPAIAKAWQWSEAWRGECVEGVAQADARPGEKVAVSNGGVTFVRYRVGDRLRDPPSDILGVAEERPLGDSPQSDWEEIPWVVD